MQIKTENARGWLDVICTDLSGTKPYAPLTDPEVPVKRARWVPSWHGMCLVPRCAGFPTAD
eukprot:12925098-Prorocentrum_lima.AAC.1